MSLFRLDASIRGDQSVSRQVADTAESAWRRVHPDGVVVRRDLADSPVPATYWPQAVAAMWTPEEQRTPQMLAAQALGREFADELLAADSYVFALPLYNWGVHQYVKAWVDLLVTDPRFRAGEPTPLPGRPAALILTRGGGYGPGTPKEGWDHASGWYKRIFGDVFGLDLHVSEVELTLAEVSPAMESLRPMAAQLLQAGHESADKHGQLIGELVLAG